MQLLNSSNETVSNRDLSEEKIYVVKTDLNNNGVKGEHGIVTGKTSMLKDIEEKKKSISGTFDQTI